MCGSACCLWIWTTSRALTTRMALWLAAVCWLRRWRGPHCAAFRYGGDEFVALMPGTDKENGLRAAMKVRDDLRAARFLEGAGLSLSISGSFGMATFPEDGATVPTILRAADTMMYEAKNATRDNVAVAGRGLLLEMSRADGAARVGRK